MERYLQTPILTDLPRKIVLLTGPRQSGKTTLAKMLSDDFDYLNFDNPEHRLGLMDRSWDRSRQLVIFDELHKLKNWKSWLKGIYDTEKIPPWIIVAGSAKLDTYRKVGDSLAGRFFQFRLHPLDLKEIRTFLAPADLEAAMLQLMETGGFPEPFLEGDVRFYNRWKRSHLDIILKQDLIDLENVQQITSIETLIQLLRRRVGSPISYNALARDLQCSDKTVKRWLEILENMYVVFRVTPYHRNVARAILKAPKFYFFDTGQVIGDQGVKLENLAACALLKEIHYMEDCRGEPARLHYLMTKDSKEVDFLVTIEGTPFLMAEVKWADDKPARNLAIFEKYFPGVKKLQLVGKLSREKTYPDGTEVRAAHRWLADPTLIEK
ncbi:ATP-binding protein [Desulfosarcina sp.]|uniref:ATP-binding protein n=1 Tax=Desulfosarcina sp. TaxID=2027861 RepID=UPI00397111C1